MSMCNNEAKWVPSSNGTVEKNAIEGGKIGNEIIYVCRDNNLYAEMDANVHICFLAYVKMTVAAYFAILDATL
ncbi:hypothetical protein PV325_007817, partial [Microctonus aethiopoides]